MKFLLLINLICGLIIANKAGVSRGVFEDTKHPEKCVVGDVIMSYGDEAKDPFSNCGRMICEKHGIVQFQTCGNVEAPEGYKLGKPMEPLAIYPNCCKLEFLPIEN